MDTVLVSPKYQVVIPRNVRTHLGLKPGERLMVLHYDDRIVLIPQRPAKKLRGTLSGMDTSIERDDDR